MRALWLRATAHNMKTPLILTLAATLCVITGCKDRPPGDMGDPTPTPIMTPGTGMGSSPATGAGPAVGAGVVPGSGSATGVIQAEMTPTPTPPTM